MSPVLLVSAGVAAILGAALVLRTFGSGYRIGRLLASTRQVGVDAALGVARAGEERYVRIDGRIDSQTDFEDEHHRPLVFRRRRLEVRKDGRWLAVDDSREAVEFEIRDGLSAISVDSTVLDEGLVVIPRESIGTAADAYDHVPADVPPDAPVRMRVQQVSSVEHAIVLGVPVLTTAGTAAITAGAGRPLVLTTLEPAEAMRLLAGGRRTRPLLAIALLAAGAGSVVLGAAWAMAGMVR